MKLDRMFEESLPYSLDKAERLLEEGFGFAFAHIMLNKGDLEDLLDFSDRYRKTTPAYSLGIDKAIEVLEEISYRIQVAELTSDFLASVEAKTTDTTFTQAKLNMIRNMITEVQVERKR